MEDNREPVGTCIMCGHALFGENEDYYSDDYVVTDDGLVCMDCWRDYGWELIKRQKENGIQ